MVNYDIPMSTLGDFKSRCMILCACKYCMPKAICFAHAISLDGGTSSPAFK